MPQLSRFEREAPVLIGQLSSSRFFQKSFEIKKKLHVKILAATNEIRCVRCSWPALTS